MNSKKIAWGSCISIFILGLLLMVILLPLSIKYIDNNEMCLTYHTVSKRFDRDQTPLNQGRYLMTPGDRLIYFKKVFVLIEMEESDSVDCLSMDGLTVNLDITFQYKLPSNSSLSWMYLSLGDNYADILQLQSKEAVRDACGHYNSTDFYFKRQDIQTHMNDILDKKLMEMNITTGFFQLINVRFAPDFMAAISNTQTAIQDIEKAENERNQDLTQAQTVYLETLQIANRTLIEAAADVNIIEIKALNEAAGIIAQIDSEIVGYLEIMQMMDFTPQDLINYISITTIQQQEKTTIAMQHPAILTF